MIQTIGYLEPKRCVASNVLFHGRTSTILQFVSESLYHHLLEKWLPHDESFSPTPMCIVCSLIISVQLRWCLLLSQSPHFGSSIRSCLKITTWVLPGQTQGLQGALKGYPSIVVAQPLLGQPLIEACVQIISRYECNSFRLRSKRRCTNFRRNESCALDHRHRQCHWQLRS